jgi:hypothetical protein
MDGLTELRAMKRRLEEFIAGSRVQEDHRSQMTAWALGWVLTGRLDVWAKPRSDPAGGAHARPAVHLTE